MGPSVPLSSSEILRLIKIREKKTLIPGREKRKKRRGRKI